MLKQLCFQSSDVWTATYNLFRTASRERITLGAIIPVTELSACSVYSIMPDRDILELTKCVGCTSMLKIICNCLKNLKLLRRLFYKYY